MTSEEAFRALAQGSPAERLLAIQSSRQQPENDLLWREVLHYFGTTAPEEHGGHFPTWFGLTLTPDRGAQAFRSLFASVANSGRKAILLQALQTRILEAAYSQCDLAAVNCRKWGAGQADLCLELMRGWQTQLPAFELYACSQHLCCRLADTFLPLLPQAQRPELAQACLRSLLVHHIPPHNAALFGLPQGVVQWLPADSLPDLLELLGKGLNALTLEILKPYGRKKSPNPTHLWSFRLASDALSVLISHPDWSSDLERHPFPGDRRLIRAVTGLLWHTGEHTRWGEKPDEIIQRFPILSLLGS